MSIKAQIAKLEKDGDIIRFAPRVRKPLKRRLFLTQDLMQVLGDSNSAIALLEGVGPLTASMERWVRGERIYKGFLKRLRPPPADVWEMRITQPQVQWRLFCRFAYPDTLIATHVHSRQKLGPEFVKRKRSQIWLDAMSGCVTEWRSKFPEHEPLVGHDWARDYISKPVEDHKV